MATVAEPWAMRMTADTSQESRMRLTEVPPATRLDGVAHAGVLEHQAECAARAGDEDDDTRGFERRPNHLAHVREGNLLLPYQHADGNRCTE